MSLPSSALASLIVTAALSSLLMVPVPVSVAVTVVPVGTSDVGQAHGEGFVGFQHRVLGGVEPLNVLVSPFVPVKAQRSRVGSS